MDSPFDKQSSTSLFRKWYVIGKKIPGNKYDQEQIDSLTEHIQGKLKPLINELCVFPRRAFRATMPFLYINHKEFISFDVDILIIGNTVECLNIPGCIVEGASLKEAFLNLIKAVIQCSDARRLANMWFQNQVFTLKLYSADESPAECKALIEKFVKDGWTIVYKGPYHNVLLRSGSKVSYVIPNEGRVSSTVNFAYNILQFQISAKTHYDLYTATTENTYWSCDICGGSESTGCLYFDPTECPR